MKTSQLVTIALICWYFIIRHYVWKLFLSMNIPHDSSDRILSYIVAFPVAVLSAMVLITLGLGLGGYFG